MGFFKRFLERKQQIPENGTFEVRLKILEEKVSSLEESLLSVIKNTQRQSAEILDCMTSLNIIRNKVLRKIQFKRGDGPEETEAILTPAFPGMPMGRFAKKEEVDEDGDIVQ